MSTATFWRRAARGLALVALALAALAAPAALAQTAPTATLTGIVVDAQTGETLIGVNVLVLETSTGATTDLDGRYTLRLPAGTYTLQVSYTGYDRQTVQGVTLAAGERTSLDIALTPTSFGLGEVVVTAQALQGNTEAGLLALQSRAPAILDGISAQQIRRAPDANSGEALRRVTGVSVAGGRFAFVRGMPERYSGTLLNGAPVASTEPDRRAFSYDLIPSNLLESLLVTKTATPDMPGDFAGGVLVLNTVDFPERPTASLSFGSGVTPGVTGQAFQFSVRGGGDLLGLDDGTRSLPRDFPQTNLARLSRAELEAMQPQLVQALPNNWQQRNSTVALPSSFALSGGSSALVGRTRVGAVAALTYRNSFSATNIIRREIEIDDFFRFDYTGRQSALNVAWGGLFNATVRPSNFHSVSFKNLYSRTADDEFTTLTGLNTESSQEQQRTAMRFLSRDVYSGQLIGDHFFPGVLGQGLQLRWDASRAFVSRDEPDYRQILYVRNEGSDGPFVASIPRDVRLGSGGRFYSSMDEGAWGGALRLTVPTPDVRFTAGASAEIRDRDFRSRLIGPATTPRTDVRLLELPIDQIFRPENFGPNGFILTESGTGSGSYEAQQDILAGFAMVDWTLAPITRKLRFVGGLRAEQGNQLLSGTTFQGAQLDVERREFDWLPSANLTYSFSPRTNARVAYSRTINRPELRELFPYAYYDFETQTTIYGDENLRQASIQNFDARLETYPGAGQMLSASVFYKRFVDAIERVVVSGVGGGGGGPGPPPPPARG
ncbi:MAG: TonB-dependent receptor domain-containing protein, partial [Rubricoccaceae bacterium]